MARKDIKPIADYRLSEYLEIGKIADFYGFTPSKNPHISKLDLQITKQMKEDLLPAEKSALIGMYLEGMQSMPQPVSFAFERPFIGGAKKKPKRLEYALHTVNSTKSILECISIQTTIAILNSIGYKNISIKINSIGDKESFADFERKLSAFIRKNINYFPQDLKQAVKKDLFAIVKEKKNEWTEFQKDCPQSIEFLTESSRLHLKEIIEYMEMISIPYYVDGSLLGDKLCSTEIIFEIIDDNTGETLAEAMRWNKIAKLHGAKKDLQCFTVNIRAKINKAIKKIKPKKINPKFYLVQFGIEAKNKSFIVLEILRKEGVPVLHSMAKDKLASQMTSVENSGIPFIILIGQKEAIENCVIIRNVVTREQNMIPIPELASYLKNNC